MSFFDELTNFFGGGTPKGAEDLEGMLNQGITQLQNYGERGVGYLSPYNDAGMGQLGTLQKAIMGMSNPGQFFNNMMSGYKESPMASSQREMGTNDALAAASASGMTGSSDLLRQVNQQSQNISNQDQQQYFNNLMGINNQGLGMAQNLFNTGYGAAGNMAGLMGNLGNSIANMYGQIGQAKMQGDQGQARGLAGLLGAGLGVASKIPGLNFL